MAFPHLAANCATNVLAFGIKGCFMISFKRNSKFATSFVPNLLELESRLNPAGFLEPVTLSADPSSNILEVVLRAHQSTISLDTVANPVGNALTFAYELVRGTASNGQTTGDNLYPGPTLHVNPGQTLIFHLENGLEDLTIPDFQNPQMSTSDIAPGDIPLYPEPMTMAPLNNHVHGIHVSPLGNSDNVLLNVSAGYANTYTYAIPTNHPQGLYWYHSHLHMLTATETYRGLLGMLAIGDTSGGIPKVTDNSLTVRNMAIQYNYVFDRAGNLADPILNNANWPALVSTYTLPQGVSSITDGTYDPKLYPVNFTSSTVGTDYFTAWYTGLLGVNNNRSIYNFMPSNLQKFVQTEVDPVTMMPTGVPVPGGKTVDYNYNLPQSQRDFQYTINGQFQPEITSRPGATEVWVVGNFSDFGFANIQINEYDSANHLVAHQPIVILGVDGTPVSTVQSTIQGGGTTLLLSPATRYALAVNMPTTPGNRLVLELPPTQYPETVGAGAQNPGILYTNNGTANANGYLGQITIDPSSVSWYDGFFPWPTQVLATVTTAGAPVVPVTFTPGESTGVSAIYPIDTIDSPLNDTRTLVIGGGFTNTNVNQQDPNGFMYNFDGTEFPYVPLLQPRLNTVEQWNFTNNNNDQHPIHIHVNDFQVMSVNAPLTPALNITNAQYTQDNVLVPVPLADNNGVPLIPGTMSLRTDFQDFIGTYVTHCHRLNHEDNGLMATINVIPENSFYGVGVPGSPGVSSSVEIYSSGNGSSGTRAIREKVNMVVPFPGFQGKLIIAMGDVNGDSILDLIVGAGFGGGPRVKVYSGAVTTPGQNPFTEVLANFFAFDSSFTGGISVAAGIINGDNAQEIIVGSGVGMASTIGIFTLGTAKETLSPTLISQIHPFPGFLGGTNIATGSIDASGRTTIVAAAGPGGGPHVATFQYPLFNKIGEAPTTLTQIGNSIQTSSFWAFSPNYLGGISVATGWTGGVTGGLQSIVVGSLTGASHVKIFSGGNYLFGSPTIYVMDPNMMDPMFDPMETASFYAFGSGPMNGMQISCTSTIQGANLLVAGEGANGPEIKQFDFEPVFPVQGQEGMLIPRLLNPASVVNPEYHPPAFNPDRLFIPSIGAQ